MWDEIEEIPTLVSNLTERQAVFVPLIFLELSFVLIVVKMMYTISQKFRFADYSSRSAPAMINNTLVTVFVVYHFLHHGFLFLLVNYAIDHGLLNPDTGLDWELWIAWLTWILAIVLFTSFFKYLQCMGWKLESPCLRILTQFCPGVGNDIHMAKDWNVVGLCFMQAHCQSGLQSFLGYVLGMISIIVMFLPLADLLESNSTMESFLAAHWPVVASRAEAPARKRRTEAIGWLEYMGFPNMRSITKFLVSHTTSAKLAIAIKTETPQVIIHAGFLVLFHGSPFVIGSMCFSAAKHFTIFAVRPRLPKLVREHGDDVTFANYIIQTLGFQYTTSPRPCTQSCIILDSANKEVLTADWKCMLAVRAPLALCQRLLHLLFTPIFKCGMRGIAYHAEPKNKNCKVSNGIGCCVGKRASGVLKGQRTMRCL